MYLDPNLSLFNQGVSENSTIIIQPATKNGIFLFSFLLLYIYFNCHVINIYNAEVQAASVHIWEEPENANTIVYNGDNFEIHAATINKLVERLTSEKDHDPDFTQ